MMLELIQHVAREQPTLLVFEDTHWMDSPSWKLILSTIFEVHPLIGLLPFSGTVTFFNIDVISANGNKTDTCPCTSFLQKIV